MTVKENMARSDVVSTKRQETGIWYASFWFNYGMLLFRGFRFIPEGDPIPEEPEDLPEEWEKVREKYTQDDEGVSAFYIMDKRKIKHSYNFVRDSHAEINANWHRAARGMVTVIEGIERIVIPPELNTPIRKKRLLEAINPGTRFSGARVKIHVDQKLKSSNTSGQEEIIAGHTDKGEMICICDHCRCSSIPHFTWYPKQGEPVRLMMEKPMPLDPNVNMELQERKKLQQYLSFSNWQKMITIWNEHNTHQMSQMAHVPNYINLQTNRFTSGWHEKAVIQKDGEIIAEVFIDPEETEERPHFHYRRPNGTEVMISLISAQYLEPLNVELNRMEKSILAEFMTEIWPKDFNGFSVYDRLCFVWDSVYDTNWFLTGQYADIFPMPDYTKLKRASAYDEQYE